MSDITELIQVVVGAKKPLTAFEGNHTTNNGFMHYHPNFEKLKSDDQSIEVTEVAEPSSENSVFSLHVPPEIKQLVLLSYEVSKAAQSGNHVYRARMNPSCMFVNDEGILYVTGGILFNDEVTLQRLAEYFDVKVLQSPSINAHFNHGGLEVLLMLKDLGHAVQFAARGVEWSTSQGYARMCLGHIPKYSNTQFPFSQQSPSATDALCRGLH